jgi:hypothetical protein
VANGYFVDFVSDDKLGVFFIDPIHMIPSWDVVVGDGGTYLRSKAPKGTPKPFSIVDEVDRMPNIANSIAIGCTGQGPADWEVMADSGRRFATLAGTVLKGREFVDTQYVAVIGQELSFIGQFPFSVYHPFHGVVVKDDHVGFDGTR